MGGESRGESLFSSGVLVERGETVALSSDFEAAVEDYRARVADCSRDELVELLAERVDESRVDSFVGFGEADAGTVAELCALSDRLHAASDEVLLSLLPALRLFRPQSPPSRGAPEPFVPVRAELVPHFAAVYSRLLVYVWLDDCPPCDAMRRRLEAVFKRSRDVMPFAVYGPDERAFLGETYDVTAGPALLFIRDGAVDARLYGDHERSVIEAELEHLRA